MDQYPKGKASEKPIKWRHALAKATPVYFVALISKVFTRPHLEKN